MNPIETGNIVLIGVGVLLILSGPYIIYRTFKGFVDRRRGDSKAEVHWLSDGLNVVVAVLFFIAGILFIINNLRGNPLA